MKNPGLTSSRSPSRCRKGSTQTDKFAPCQRSLIRGESFIEVEISSLYLASPDEGQECSGVGQIRRVRRFDEADRFGFGSAAEGDTSRNYVEEIVG